MIKRSCGFVASHFKSNINPSTWETIYENYKSVHGSLSDGNRHRSGGIDLAGDQPGTQRLFVLITPYFGTPIPQLTVIDRDGKVLISGVQSTAPAALQQFAALLEKPVGQN
jgi:hypothetical protein